MVTTYPVMMKMRCHGLQHGFMNVQGNMEYIDDIMSTDESGEYTGYIKRIIPETYNTNIWYNSWTHCWDTVWAGAFLKLHQLFPENELYKFIARWNVEYLSGGAAKHEDPSDVNYVITSPCRIYNVKRMGALPATILPSSCVPLYI